MSGKIISMNKHRDDEEKVFVICECSSHGICIELIEDSAFSEKLYCLNFWTQEWFCNNDNIFTSAWNRIKLAYKVLANGDYFVKEIILSEESMDKLKKHINSGGKR